MLKHKLESRNKKLSKTLFYLICLGFTTCIWIIIFNCQKKQFNIEKKFRNLWVINTVRQTTDEHIVHTRCRRSGAPEKYFLYFSGFLRTEVKGSSSVVRLVAQKQFYGTLKLLPENLKQNQSLSWKQKHNLYKIVT